MIITDRYSSKCKSIADDRQVNDQIPPVVIDNRCLLSFSSGG